MLQRTRDAEFAAVYAAHHAEALRVAYLWSGDRDRAEDAVAEAFVKVYRRWQRGGIRNPRAYIKRAVRNEVTSRFRRLALERREAARRWGDHRGERSAETQLVERDELLTALRQLPERQRTAIVLRYYGDMSEAQVAQVMGVSLGTAKSSIHRALGNLRVLLGAPPATAQVAAPTGMPVGWGEPRCAGHPARLGRAPRQRRGRGQVPPPSATSGDQRMRMLTRW